MSAQKNDNEDVEASEETIKPSEYVKELLKEKLSLNPEHHGNAMRLIDQEVAKAQAQTGGKPYKPENRYVDIYKDKPIKVVTKVLVPVKEHPKFNFVGKLLGPKGNSLKRLQEETMTKMAILGRGSMRDKTKEEEFRNALDPKYSHLNDELHVEIQVLATPAEAYARIAYALAEIRKYLVPDVNDEIRQEQLREIQQYSGTTRGGRGGGAGPTGRGGPVSGRGGSLSRGGPLRPPVMPPRGANVPPIGAPVPPRPIPGKTKVMSILDRARVAMEESYGPSSYDDGYFEAPTTMGYTSGGYGSAYNGSGFYDSGYDTGTLERNKKPVKPVSDQTKDAGDQFSLSFTQQDSVDSPTFDGNNYGDKYSDNYGDKYSDNYGDKYSDNYGDNSRGGGDGDGGEGEGIGGWKNYGSSIKQESSGGGKMMSSRGTRGTRGSRGTRGGFGSYHHRPYSRPSKLQH